MSIQRDSSAKAHAARATFRRQLKRRGLVAGVAALTAAMLAKASTRLAQAAQDGTPWIVGQDNSEINTTSLRRGDIQPRIPTLLVSSINGNAIEGRADFGSSYGVFGESRGPLSNGPGGVGVFGTAIANSFCTGVYGLMVSNGVGIFGDALGSSATAIVGRANQTPAAVSLAAPTPASASSARPRQATRPIS
jgi:hypothetical protein